MKPNGSSTKSLLTWKGCTRDACGLGTTEPQSSQCQRLLGRDQRHPQAGSCTSRMGEKTRTCQAQVAQHHHISIFIECCRLSNVKLCCYLCMCRFSPNADILAPYENSFSPFRYFLLNQSKVFKSLSSFSFLHNKDGCGFFASTQNPRQCTQKPCGLGVLFLGLRRTGTPQNHQHLLQPSSNLQSLTMPLSSPEKLTFWKLQFPKQGLEGKVILAGKNVILLCSNNNFCNCCLQGCLWKMKRALFIPPR